MERLLVEAEAKMAEAARAGATDRMMGPALASAAEAVGSLRARAKTRLRLLRLATKDARFLGQDARRAGARGPLKTGRAASKPDEERRRGGMRHDLVRLAKLEAAGRTDESEDRGRVRLPKDRTTWALASIALGIDRPRGDADEFAKLRRDVWRHVIYATRP